MNRTQWLVVALGLLATAGAQAADKTRVYIAPYAGYTHLRIDNGFVLDQVETLRLDALTLGASLGVRTSFGLIAEIGRSDAFHTDFFWDDHDDISLEQTYGAVGWRFEFADGWAFTPKVGRARWELKSRDYEWFSDDDERSEVDGWDNFWEASLSHDFNERFSLGVHFKDVSQQFGHSRSGTVFVSFAF